MGFYKIALLFFFAAGVPVFADTVPLKWDFESGTQDWLPWGVNADSGLSSAQMNEILTVSEIAPYEGRKGLLLKDDSETANPYMSLGKAVTVDVKKKYYFRGYIKSGDNTPVPAAVGIAAESNGKFVKWFKAKVEVSGDWQEFSLFTDVIPKETTHLRPSVFIFNDNAPAGKGSVFLDNLSFGECSFIKADMSRAVNRAFMDENAGDGIGGWTDQGDNDLRKIKGGEKVVSNIPFDIFKPAKMTDPAVIGLRKNGGFAGSAELQVPDIECDWIYILNTAAWARGNAGKIKINYADGSSETVPVNCGGACRRLVGRSC